MTAPAPSRCQTPVTVTAITSRQRSATNATGQRSQIQSSA